MPSSLISPSFHQGFARSAGVSAHPERWRDFVGGWVPALGIQGEQLFDVSGSRSHGALVTMDPATDWVVNEKGLALDFDRVDDHIDIGTFDEFGIEFSQRKTTVIFNIKTDNTTSIMYLCGTINDGGNTLYQVIINADSEDNLNEGFIAIFMRNESDSRLSGHVASNTGITDGKPHQIAWLVDPVNAVIRINVDGVDQNITYTNSSSLSGSSSFFQYPMVLGARAVRAVIGGFYGGMINSSTFYTRELSEKELQVPYLDLLRLREPAPFFVPAAPSGAIPHSVFQGPFAGPFVGAF